MPTIEHRELREQSVESALTNVKRALLPKEIQEHYLVQWVLSFDKPKEQADFRQRSFREDQALKSVLLREIGQNFVQPAISYYHFVLMQLGPQWELVVEGQASIKALLRPQNLAMSVQSLQTMLPPGAPSHVFLKDVEYFARGASDAWEHRRELVQKAWSIWTEEVKELYESIKSADHDSRWEERRFPTA